MMFAKTEQQFAKEAAIILNDALKEQGVYLLHPEKLEAVAVIIGKRYSEAQQKEGL